MNYSKKLTRTEEAVVEKILLGFSRPVIAEIFKCNAGQITRTMNHVYEKVGVRTREEFMAKRIAELEDLLHKNGIDYD